MRLSAPASSNSTTCPLDGVELAEDVAGYDVIARIQAPSLDQLGKLVARHVQLDGVTRTLTCTVIHR